jgi:hypothetical protein
VIFNHNILSILKLLLFVEYFFSVFYDIVSTTESIKWDTAEWLWMLNSKECENMQLWPILSQYLNIYVAGLSKIMNTSVRIVQIHTMNYTANSCKTESLIYNFLFWTDCFEICVHFIRFLHSLLNYFLVLNDFNTSSVI